ncbi:hypothetical protein [Streptomyces arenae]|uniref:hypothetical protein n=1 Tax=Streptomyces arenae TaxID=29301 RepID=UPI00265B1DEE|nr:hypothetical protein [Streptomyces arenae]MCG7202303.1 hypothetical protein [Streptomyces arenae]
MLRQSIALRLTTPFAVVALTLTACGGKGGDTGAAPLAPTSAKPSPSKTTSTDLVAGNSVSGKITEDVGTITYGVSALELTFGTEAQAKAAVQDPADATGKVIAIAHVRYTHQAGPALTSATNADDSTTVWAGGRAARRDPPRFPHQSARLRRPLRHPLVDDGPVPHGLRVVPDPGRRQEGAGALVARRRNCLRLDLPGPGCIAPGRSAATQSRSAALKAAEPDRRHITQAPAHQPRESALPARLWRLGPPLSPYDSSSMHRSLPEEIPPCPSPQSGFRTDAL